MSRSMLFNIMSTNKDGEPVIRKVVDISLPRTNGEPRKIGETMTDHLKAALRMYGCRHIHSANGDVYAMGSRSGKRIWAEPVNVKAGKVKSADKPAKVKPAKVNNSVPAEFDPAIHAVDSDGNPVFKLDGTLAKRRGRKPSGTVTVKPQDAPYGYKSDGVTPRRKPGRKGKNKSVTVKSQKVNSPKGNKSLSPKDEFNAMLDGSIPMNADRLRELTALIVAAA